MRFDLLLKGGEVVDPSAGYSGNLDVAVKRDRIAAVDTDIPAESAFQVIDVSGQYVTPGLIDLHAHIYEGVTYWGVSADAIGSQSGVTTWVDAGSAGAVTFQGFRDYIIEPSKVKVFAYINIAYIGLVAQDYELTNTEYSNIELLKSIVNKNRDVIVGIKIRAGQSGGGKDLVPFERARIAADELELPIMIHLSTSPPDVETALSYLKPGDIITHCYTGQSMKMIDDDGNILPGAKKAIEDGVILDLGHGAGSLSFVTAESLMKQGYLVDVISTDLHHLSIVGPNLILDDPGKGHVFADRTEDVDARSAMVQVHGDGDPVFNMLTCFDKMLFLGMSFPEIIQATTSRPAKILGLERDIGTLKPGACADIATFIIDEGDIELKDIHGQVRIGKESVRNIYTFLDGRPFEPIEIPGHAPWIKPAGKE